MAVICGDTRKHAEDSHHALKSPVSAFTACSISEFAHSPSIRRSELPRSCTDCKLQLSAVSKVSSRSRVLTSCTIGVELACVGWSHRAHSSGHSSGSHNSLVMVDFVDQMVGLSMIVNDRV